MMVSPILRQGLNGILDASEALDGFGSSLGSGDFDGDGFDDLAIGVPLEDVFFQRFDRRDAGAVNVLYGSGTGLTGVNDDFWTQGSAGVEEAPEGIVDQVESFTIDNFGFSVGVGDFDGDGRDDLAIGVPGENIDNADRSGAVNVLYGSSSGLTAASDQLWHQDQPGVKGKAERNDEYGRSLTVGDFNNDGRDDLAIGIPGDSPLVNNAPVQGAGGVNVLYGSANVGLRGTGSQYWLQSELGRSTRARDNFGESLTAGDFNGDGFDDLAVGTPFKDLPQRGNVGVVNVIYGSSTGLASTNNQVWSQGGNSLLDVQGTAEAFDQFGTALAAGDFDGDGRDDLAIGSPLDNEGLNDAGTVNVLYGSSNRLNVARNQLWRQRDVGNRPRSREGFGSSLGVGDFNGDGRDDLAIGTPNDGVDGGVAGGSVNVIYGTSQGLSAVGGDRFHQNTPGVEGVAEAGDRFGASLGIGDYNRDGFDDLAIGVPGDNPIGINSAGTVNIIFGSSTGLRVDVFTPT